MGREDILGIEAPLWSETLETMDDIEYMAFPRLPGIAEVAWTTKDQRDWAAYSKRLGAQKKRFEIMGIDYYASERVPWSE